jgi:4-azaleucine resistance transporter AzlC
LTSVAFGLAFGVLSRESGLTLAEACLMSAAVNAGSSQLVALSMWATPIPVASIVATTLLVNLRLALLSMTLRPWYERLPGRLAFGTFFFLTDGAWALTLIEFQRGLADGAFLLGVGLVMFVCWVGATAIGRATGGFIRDPSSWGLDFALVAVFVSMLVAMVRQQGRPAILPWALAAGVSIAADRLLPGNWFILLGALAGTIPAMRRRSRA